MSILWHGINAIARSTDSGVTWKTVYQDTSFSFSNITAGPNGKMYADGQTIAGKGAIYTNIQGDSVWQKVITPDVNEWDFILAVGGNIGIAVPKDGYGNKLFRTTDGGSEWDTIQDLSYYSAIAKDSSGLLWALGTPVMVSSDSGATWANTQFPPDVNASNICITPSNEICMRTEQHIYKFSRNDQQWSLLKDSSLWEDSLLCSNIYAIIAFSDDSIIVANNQGYYRTGDGGQSWAKDSMDRNVVFSSSLMLRGPAPYLIRDSDGYLYSGQLRYDPIAAEWENIRVIIDSFPITFFNPVVLAVDSSGYVFANNPITQSEILRSSDHGITWDSISDSPSGWGQMAVDPQGRIVSATGTVIVRSSDHGETWNTLASGYSVGGIVVSQNGTILAEDEGIDALGYYYMIESTDDGTTWEVNRQFQPWSFALDGPNKLYASGTVWTAKASLPTMGIMISTDTGKTGQIISQSTDTAFDFVAVSPNHTLFAGSAADGLFRYVPGAASVETIVSSPENFTIFPNPATNQIQIISGVGNISILDPLGRSYEVKQTGSTLDVSALPSGVYFVSDGHTRAKFVKE